MSESSQSETRNRQAEARSSKIGRFFFGAKPSRNRVLRDQTLADADSKAKTLRSEAKTRNMRKRKKRREVQAHLETAEEGRSLPLSISLTGLQEEERSVAASPFIGRASTLGTEPYLRSVLIARRWDVK